MRTSLLRIVTRQSKLALIQATEVQAKLKALYPEINIELIPIKTTGDNNLDVSLTKIGGKGLFVKELEHYLLNDLADIAIHSMKDVPANLPPELEIVAILKRLDPHDVLVSNDFSSIDNLPPKTIIGTSSLRRTAQIAAIRKDLTFKMLRGNVDTRLEKLDKGAFQAIILAKAGLERLNLHSRITQIFETNLMLPAVGQGALGIECRKNDKQTKRLIAPLHHLASAQCVLAERSMNACLGGSCQLPVAALATLKKNRMTLQGLVGRPDGSTLLKASASAALNSKEALTLGESLADMLLALGAQDIIDACQEQS